MDPLRGKARSILYCFRMGLVRKRIQDACLHRVNSSIAKGLHARVVVLGRVDAVDTNSVDVELLEEREVPRASISVDKGVGEARRFKERVVWVVFVDLTCERRWHKCHKKENRTHPVPGMQYHECRTCCRRLCRDTCPSG